MRSNCFRVFGLGGSREFAERVAGHLDVPLSPHIENSWDDGEFFVRADTNVRNCDCFVIQSLYGDEKESVSTKTLKMAYFCGSIWDASARRVTLVIPYLAWSRQDRKSESRAPVYTRYLASMLESVKADRLMSMDIHNVSAINNAYRDMRADELQAKKLLADAICKEIIAEGIDPHDLTILSPDVGGGKRAEAGRTAVAKRLGADFIDVVQIDKMRSGRVVKAQRLTGSVKGKKCLLWDDLISTASSMRESQKIVEENGGEVWGAAVTHGLFVGDANDNIARIPRIFITDTVNPWRLSAANRSKVRVVSTAHLFAQAIRRTYEDGGSISELLDD